MKTKLIVIVAVVLACGCAFWIASTGRVVGVPARLPGVPANTIAQAAKAARALRKASVAHDIGSQLNGTTARLWRLKRERIGSMN